VRLTATPTTLRGVLAAALGEPGDGWVAAQGRLLVYAVIAIGIWGLTAPFVPRELPWVTLPGLVGALVGARVLRALDGRPGIGIGFTPDRAAPGAAGKGMALGVGVALLAVALIALLGGLRWSEEPGSALAWLRTGARALWLLAIPAAAEEALVRGYPLRAVAEAKGPGWALGFTSLGFAALHLLNPGIDVLSLVNLAAAGLLLGAVALRTGSLWWATGVHLGWNWALAFLADVPVSGLETVDAPLISASVGGPAWLSGGDFGPEGSLLAGVVMLGAAAWVWRTRALAPRPIIEGTAEPRTEER
jgi:membrane protease YdiL (CAAX protease family)